MQKKINTHESVTKIFFLYVRDMRGKMGGGAAFLRFSCPCPFYARFMPILSVFLFQTYNDESATGTKVCTQPAVSDRATTVVEMVSYA